MPGRFLNPEKYRFGYNGEEKDDEIKGVGNSLDFGNRINDVRLGRWLSVDPLAENYVSNSTYSSMSNNPVNRIDPSGMGDYYKQSGTHICKDNNTSDDKVYLVSGNSDGCSPTEIEQAYLCGQEGQNSTSGVNVELTDIKQSTLIRFASLIYDESRGGMLESYGIGSATMNYIRSVNKSNYTIDKLVRRTNHYSYGVDGENFKDFMKLYSAGKGNNRFALGAALNALTSGFDVTYGATRWDGGDLCQYSFTNSNFNDPKSHRAGGIFASYQLLGTFNNKYQRYFNKFYKRKGSDLEFQDCFVPLLSQPSLNGNYDLKATIVHGGTIFFQIYNDNSHEVQRGWRSKKEF